MRGVGFYTGAPWCGYFCRLAINMANDPMLSLITGSAVTTMRRAAKAKNWHTYPVPGSVAVYRRFKNGKPLSSGHLCSGLPSLLEKDDTDYG